MKVRDLYTTARDMGLKKGGISLRKTNKDALINFIQGYDLQNLQIGRLYRKAVENGLPKGVLKLSEANRSSLINVISGDKTYQTPRKNLSYNNLLTEAKQHGLSTIRGRRAKVTKKMLISFLERRENSAVKVIQKGLSKRSIWHYEPTYVYRRNDKTWKNTKSIFIDTRQSNIKKAIAKFDKEQQELDAYIDIDEKFTYVLTKTASSELSEEDLRNVRMMKTVPSKFHFAEHKIELNPSETGTCVYDFIEGEYNVKREKFLKMLREKDSKTDNFIDTPLQSKQRTLEDGVSFNDLVHFCRKLRIKMYGLSIDRRAFGYYDPETEGVKKNKNHRNLIFVLMDQHMYPIVDTWTRKSIEECENPNKKKGLRYFNKKGKKKDEGWDMKSLTVIEEREDDMFVDFLLEAKTEGGEAKGNVVLESSNLKDLYFRIFAKTNTYYHHKFITDIMTEIHLGDDKVILANPDIETVLVICQKFGFKFNNQRIASLFNKIDCENVDKRLSSVMTIENLDKFLKQTDIGAFNDCFTHQYNADKLTGIDVNNCYIDCLVNTDIDWAISTLFDEVMPYNNHNILPHGFYFAMSNNYFPAKGNSWYSGEMVKYLKAQDIPHRITHQFIPSRSMSADTYVPTVSKLKEKLSKKAFKATVLQFIGCLNKKYSSKGKTTICPDLNTTAYLYFKSKNAGDDEPFVSRPYIPDCDKQPFLLQTKKVVRKQSTNCLMYLQIMNRSWIRLHETFKKVGGELVGIKTDKLILYKPVDVEAVIGEDIGQCKVEEVKSREVAKKRVKGIQQLRNYPFDDDLKPLTWGIKQLDEGIAEAILNSGKGCILSAKAGCGKTYQLNRLCTMIHEAGKSFKTVAFTNKACGNLDGTTLHKTFNIKIGEEYTQTKASFKGLDYLIIDEISMVPSFLYNHIYSAKNAGVTIICSGDFRQLKPVMEEEKDFSKSAILHHICDGKGFEMKLNHRFDKETEAISDRLDIDKLEVVCGDMDYTLATNHICWTHKTRKLVNRMCMIANRKGKDYFTAGGTHSPAMANDKQQTTYYYVGLPLVCIKTHKKTGIVKSCFYNVEHVGVDCGENIAIVNGVWYTEESLLGYFRVSYCTTTHVRQGDTIEGEYFIWDVERILHSKPSGWKEWLYTAITRCTHHSNIKIVA